VKIYTSYLRRTLIFSSEKCAKKKRLKVEKNTVCSRLQHRAWSTPAAYYRGGGSRVKTRPED